MTTSTTMADSTKKEVTAVAQNGPNEPSGFILKLFQMVNGAPDEVITVSLDFFESILRFLSCSLVVSFVFCA